MSLVIAGTGTGVGKTLLSALLMVRYGEALGLHYLKPVQTGYPKESDTRQVKRLSGLSGKLFFKEFACFSLVASPHLAAEKEDRLLDLSRLTNYILECVEKERTLIELAGGLLAPLTRKQTNLDLLAALALPVVLVADTRLGTINHTLLSLEALGRAGVSCSGVFFVGPKNALYADNQRTVCSFSNAPHLGEFFLNRKKKMMHRLFRCHALSFDREKKIEALL